LPAIRRPTKGPAWMTRVPTRPGRMPRSSTFPSTCSCLPQLVTLLERFPKATVFLDHFARPALADGAPYALANSLWALARFENLSFKYTTHNVRESAQALATQGSFARRMVAEFGARRIAWGSNYPASKGSLAALLDEALQATAALNDEDRAWIFAGTAQRLYPELVPELARSAA